MTKKLVKLKKKITNHDHSNICFTEHKFNTLIAENFAARLAKAKLATKADVVDFIKKTDFKDNLKKWKKLLQIKQNMRMVNRK